MQINLLAPQTTSRQPKGTDSSTRVLVWINGGGFFLLIIAVVALFALDYYTNNKVAETDAHITALQDVSRQMSERSKIVAMLAQKKTQYRILLDKKPLWNEKLDELMKREPQNIVLTNLSFSNGDGNWQITGIAPSYDQVAQFGASLQDSAYFSSVRIAEAFTNAPSPGVTFDIIATTRGGAKNE